MRIKNNRLDTKEGHSGRTWLGFNGTREWRYNDGPGLGLPESVNDGTLFFPDVVIVPVPSLRVDGLTNATQHSEGAKVVGMDVVLTETTEEADGGGSSVDVGNLVLLNGLPVARWGRINGGGFEDSGGDTIEKGPVHDVTGGIDEIGEVLTQDMEPTYDR